MSTEWFRFVGMNIKGTPAMTREQVEHDLAVAKSTASVVVVQEFKWRAYWRSARKVIGTGKWKDRWNTSPGLTAGALRPVRGAQAVLWLNRDWKRLNTRVWLLHDGVAGISETRYVRAVLLEHRKTKLACWFLTTHFVVGGDMHTDGMRRRMMLAGNINTLRACLIDLRRSGHPIIGQLDANVHRQSEAYPRLLAIFRGAGAKVHGYHGVEYLFVIQGRTAKVEVRSDWIVSTSRLETDHEGRGITARLVAA
jgi:hypothetical protein